MRNKSDFIEKLLDCDHETVRFNWNRARLYMWFLSLIAFQSYLVFLLFHSFFDDVVEVYFPAPQTNKISKMLMADRCGEHYCKRAQNKNIIIIIIIINQTKIPKFWQFFKILYLWRDSWRIHENVKVNDM